MAEKNKTAEPQEKPAVPKEARTWSMFCHLAGLLGLVLPVVGNIVGPLRDGGVWVSRRGGTNKKVQNL